MAFGFPAYHTNQYSTGTAKSDDLRIAVKETFNTLSWKVKEESQDLIIASVSYNFRSWGEKVLINFLPNNSISITSKCVLPTQCFDWGKNKANVAMFMVEFRELMRPSRIILVKTN